MKLKVDSYFSPFTKMFTINLGDYGLGHIEIRKNRDGLTDKWNDVILNWGGCGKVSIQNTAIFHDALEIAQLLAYSINNNLKADVTYILEVFGYELEIIEA